MIDLRLWRIVLLGVPLALVVAMFSLRGVPGPLAPSMPPDAFEGSAAALLAKELARAHPEPRPGSEQDAALAEAVLERFRGIAAMEVSEQRFTGSYDGRDVELRNLIGILPGPSERQVALLASRDALEGSGAASGVASTAALLEIAAGFSGSTHEKTLVFVSADGGSIGALGARRFAADYSNAGMLDAIVVLSQPASRELTPPMVLPWSVGQRSTGIRLDETARRMVSEQADRPVGDETPLQDLFRLALPSALGDQGPLVESGFEAVRLSSSGELPPAPAADEEGDIDPDSIGRFGRAALSLMLAVDSAREPLEHGPGTYVRLAGNLLPGWTLALLGLALLLAPAAVGFGGVAVAAASPSEALRALGWVALRAIPFALAFGVLAIGGLAGLVPSPEFPFPPGSQDLGSGGTVVVIVSLALLAISAFLLRPLLAPPPALASLAPPAAVSLAALTGFGIWLLNPYLALLVGAGLQLWVPAAGRVAPGRLGAAALVACGLLPALAALVALGGRFDAGIGVVWDLLYMFTGGQLPDRLALLSCLLAGTGLAIVASAGDPSSAEEQLSLSALVARGRVLEQRRARRGAAPEQAPPEGDQAGSGGSPEPGPAEPAPDRDPRMWSKPPACSCEPSAPRTTAPAPSSTLPISVSPSSGPSSSRA